MIFYGSLDPKSIFARLALTSAACALSVSSQALAQAFIQGQTIPKGDVGLTPFFGIGFDDYVELGFAASFLVVPHGFIPPINNSVSVEAAIFQDVAGRDRTGFVGGRMRWDFHLHPQWSVYAAPGAGVRFGDDDRHTGAEITGDMGGFFHLNDTVSLRGEVGLGDWYDHGGLRAGVTFRL